MNQQELKEKVGEKAAEFIQDRMIVGLGSGSTSECFIQSLIQRTKEGLNIQAVSSSRRSEDLAKKGGIPVLDINDITHIDITVDGADEIDPQKRMIKGGGGAHVREKILASSSNEMVVIVDESKCKEKLGVHPLPIEVIFFGSPATKAKIEKLGYKTSIRMNQEGSFFITDNSNIIIDLHFNSPPDDLEKIHHQILDIPGVVDTGYFTNLAGRVIVGKSDGTVEIV